MRELTITLPDPIYRQVQKQSEEMQRSIADEVAAVVTASLPEQNQLPENLRMELDQLDYFSDDELWHAANSAVPEDKTTRMQELVEKQQFEGLTTSEQVEAEKLSQYFNRIMLVRAKALALLKDHGYNIDPFLNL